jgi:hypothetical protein
MKYNNKNAKSSKTNKNKENNQSIPRSLRPPQYKSSASFLKTLRFQTNASVANVCSSLMLLDLYVFAQTAIVGARLVSAIKLKRVSIWAPPIASLIPQDAFLEYYSEGSFTTGAPSRVYADQSMGADRCAYISVVPPAGSAASFWQSGQSTAQMFKYSVPANSIIEIIAEFVLPDYDTIVALSNPVLVGATPGKLYLGGLDGVRTAATQVPPLDMPVI